MRTKAHDIEDEIKVAPKGDRLGRALGGFIIGFTIGGVIGIILDVALAWRPNGPSVEFLFFAKRSKDGNER